MATVLEQICDGALNSAEWRQSKSEAYACLEARYDQHYQELMETLKKQKPPLHQEFIRVLDEQLEMTSAELEESFRGGFCMGAKLMLEIMLEGPGMKIE